MELKGLQTNQAKKIITLFCITLLTLCILFMACGAFAQNTMSVTPYFGLGYQQSYNSNFYKDPSVKLCKVPGASFGASLEDSMTTNFSLGIGLGYSNFSTQAEYSDKTAEEGVLIGSYYDNYGYVTAPISFIVRSRTSGANTIGFYGEVQLIPSINTSAIQKQTLAGSALTLDTASTTLASIKNQTHAINLMLGVSGGIFIPMNNMTIRVGPYYTTGLIDVKKGTYPDYTMVSGKKETYTPTNMRAIGANVSIAIKINSPKSNHLPVASATVSK